MVVVVVVVVVVLVLVLVLGRVVVASGRSSLRAGQAPAARKTAVVEGAPSGLGSGDALGVGLQGEMLLLSG